MALPDKNSPHVRLVVATPEELLAQTTANSVEWKGILPSVESYNRREAVLINQDLTRDGGLTPWLLVYDPPDGPRQVLCGCESLRKRALISDGGYTSDLVAHGIAGVFCPPPNRGKGYAGRMMAELGKVLETWQIPPGQKHTFSVLYSDIGKVGRPASRH